MTANEDLLDAFVRHSIYLERFKGGARTRLIAFLKDAEKEVLAKLATLDPAASPLGSARLEKLLRDIKDIMAVAASDGTASLNMELRQLAKDEAAFAASAIKTASPVVLELVTPNVNQMWAAVNARPFQTKMIKEWVAGYDAMTRTRIQGAIRQGVVEGASLQKIISRVRGVEGFTGLQRAAEVLVRTSTSHVANVAHEKMFEANDDVMDGVIWVSTLDSKTSPICRSRDGHVAMYGGKSQPAGVPKLVPASARPPAHPNCRSTTVAFFSDIPQLGTRPAKPVTQKQLLREYTEKNGLKSVTSRKALPRGHKGAFDDYSRGRVRELTGNIPAKETYQTWLKRQSKQFQEDILGKSKAKLFRDGNLPLDKFVDASGHEYTLDELRSKHGDLFERVGL